MSHATQFAATHAAYVVGPDFLRRNNMGARYLDRKWGGWRDSKVGRRFFVLDVWSRDCDMCESRYTSVIPATLAAYNAYLDDMDRNAEGPWHALIMNPAEIEDFRPGTRDRALEAWENGAGANSFSV